MSTPFFAGWEAVEAQHMVQVGKLAHKAIEETFSFHQKKRDPKSVEKWVQYLTFKEFRQNFSYLYAMTIS